MRLDPKIDPCLHEFARRTVKMFIGENAKTRLEDFFSGGEFGNRLTKEPKRAVITESERVINSI